MDSRVPLTAAKRHSADTKKPTLISLNQPGAYLLLLPLDRASAEEMLKQLSAALHPDTRSETSPGVGGTPSN